MRTERQGEAIRTYRAGYLAMAAQPSLTGRIVDPSARPCPIPDWIEIFGTGQTVLPIRESRSLPAELFEQGSDSLLGICDDLFLMTIHSAS